SARTYRVGHGPREGRACMAQDGEPGSARRSAGAQGFRGDDAILGTFGTDRPSRPCRLPQRIRGNGHRPKRRDDRQDRARAMTIAEMDAMRLAAVAATTPTLGTDEVRLNRSAGKTTMQSRKSFAP